MIEVKTQQIGPKIQSSVNTKEALLIYWRRKTTFKTHDKI